MQNVSRRFAQLLRFTTDSSETISGPLSRSLEQGIAGPLRRAQVLFWPRNMHHTLDLLREMGVNPSWRLIVVLFSSWTANPRHAPHGW